MTNLTWIIHKHIRKRWGTSIMSSMKSTSKRVVEGRVELGFAVLASSEVDAAGFVVGTRATLSRWELEQLCEIYVGF